MNRESRPIEPLDAVDMIDLVMVERGYSQADLSRVLGSRSRASEILARKRALSMAMAHRLHEAWGIPAEVLIRPYATAA